jgi:hypothetical protein
VHYAHADQVCEAVQPNTNDTREHFYRVHIYKRPHHGQEYVDDCTIESPFPLAIVPRQDQHLSRLEAFAGAWHCQFRCRRRKGPIPQGYCSALATPNYPQAHLRLVAHSSSASQQRSSPSSSPHPAVDLVHSASWIVDALCPDCPSSLEVAVDPVHCVF